MKTLNLVSEENHVVVDVELGLIVEVNGEKPEVAPVVSGLQVASPAENIFIPWGVMKAHLTKFKDVTCPFASKLVDDFGLVVATNIERIELV